MQIVTFKLFFNHLSVKWLAKRQPVLKIWNKEKGSAELNLDKKRMSLNEISDWMTECNFVF